MVARMLLLIFVFFNWFNFIFDMSRDVDGHIILLLFSSKLLHCHRKNY